MAERVTTKIGIPGNSSTGLHQVSNQQRDNIWLSKVFEISNQKAQELITNLYKNKKQNATAYIFVDITYRQLGRYVALRRSDALSIYWRYPAVEHVMEEADPPHDLQPIELRPGIKENGSN